MEQFDIRHTFDNLFIQHHFHSRNMERVVRYKKLEGRYTILTKQLLFETGFQCFE